MGMFTEELKDNCSDDLSAEESEVLRKLLNDAVPAQMDLKVGDTKSSSEMRALVVSSASPSREP